MAKILKLYLPHGGVVADLTYGKGVFWRAVGNNGGPIYRIFGSDVCSTEGGVVADAQCTPYRDACFDLVVVDPPWGGTSTTHKPAFTASRYNLASLSFKELPEFTALTLHEARRITKCWGYIVWKGQDIVWSKKRHFFSCDLWQQAVDLGLVPIDQLISVQKTPMPPSWHIKRQQHAQANHCWYWIFQKPKKGKR